MIGPKTVVVVSRYWDNPDIQVTVTDRGIGIEMLIEDYVAALAAEMGNPTTLVTRAQLKERMLAAASEVIRKMKQATNKVM